MDCWCCFGQGDRPECYDPGDTGRTVPFREIVARFGRGVSRWIGGLSCRGR